MSVNLKFSTKVIDFVNNVHKHQYMYYCGLSDDASMIINIINIKGIIDDIFIYEIIWSSNNGIGFSIGIEQRIELVIMKHLIHDGTIRVLDYFDDVDKYMLDNAEKFI